jgi:asparagine synthase (glutamine-hydrolysing)
MFLNATSYVDARDVARFSSIKGNQDLFNDFSMQNNQPFIDNMMRVDYKSFMTGDILTKVDRAMMSVSLDGREPLLDHRIIEFMARVPVELKYKNKQGKYLARQILYKHIPQAMIDKPKAGFQIPLIEWLQSDLRPLVDKYLDSSRLDEEVFNIEEVEKIKQALFAGERINISVVWFILMFQMWRERWF